MRCFRRVSASPMWAGLGAPRWASRRAVSAQRADDRLVPLMGMLGAFVFAAQMINFSDPGHRLQRAPRRRPAAGDPARAARGVRRHRLGADGAGAVLRRRRPAGAGRQHVQPRRAALLPGLPAGLPAAGRARRHRRGARPSRPSLAAVVGLQLGALGVVLQTVASGISSLPPAAFLSADAADPPGHRHRRGAGHRRAACCFLRRARPELLDARGAGARPRRADAAAAGAAGRWRPLLTGGVLSWFASTQPDGLEWSVAQVAGTAQPARTRAGPARRAARRAAAPGLAARLRAGAMPPRPSRPGARGSGAWPEVNAGTALAGVVGGAVTLALVMLVGLGLRRRRASALTRSRHEPPRPPRCRTCAPSMRWPLATPRCARRDPRAKLRGHAVLHRHGGVLRSLPAWRRCCRWRCSRPCCRRRARCRRACCGARCGWPRRSR